MDHQVINNSPPPHSNQSDAEAEMIQKLQVFEQENQYLKQENKRIQKLLDEITCSNDNQRICQCGRKLCYLFSQVLQPMLQCHKCKQKIEKISNVYWVCFPCKVYGCRQCEGYKRVVCPYSHLLESKKYNADIDRQQEQNKQEGGQKKWEKRVCDICRKDIKSLYYSCECGFDMCKQCREK